MQTAETTTKKKSLFERFIKGIEVVGNKIPHPFTMFTILAVFILALSMLLSKAGVSVTYMAASKVAGEAPIEATVTVRNLLSYEGIREILAGFVSTYVNFAPLGIIVIMMIGIGMIEQTGFISALMRKTILGAPDFMVTAVLAFVGINSNLASDAGTIFSAAIGGTLFKALGRNPVVGVITGFVAASGGFTANLFVAGTDGLLAGITESAAKSMNIDAPTHPLINWYFMIVATFVLTLVTTFVTEKFTSKYLGEKKTNKKDKSGLHEHALTEDEKRGLRWAGIAAVAFIVVILAFTLPQGSLFRNEEGAILPKSPLISSMVPLLFFLFVVVGLAYGIAAKVVKSERDIPKLMQKSLAGNLSFLVVALPAALFIDLFNKSNIATILAVSGAGALKSANLHPTILMIILIFVTAFINLCMTSGSSKWLILAPIFVPIFSMLGLSPAITQLCVRVGDSATNIISPILIYIPAIIGFMEQYKEEGDDRVIGIGSVISLTMPYSIAYMVSLILMLVVWYFLGVPIGPGTYITM